MAKGARLTQKVSDEATVSQILAWKSDKVPERPS